MKTILSPSVLVFVAVITFGGTLLAGGPVIQLPERQVKVKEVAVFVTGSHIPKRVRLEPIGTSTVSPVRIIDRREIDGTGRHTTVGVFINEPSARIVGFGH